MLNLTKTITPSSAIENVYSNILTNGYSEIKNQYITKGFYYKLYKCFDNIINLIAKNEELQFQFEKAEHLFLEVYKDIFTGAPAGYRDCHKKAGKKDQKVYFQFCEEYYSLFEKHFAHVLDDFAIIKMFFKYLRHVDEISKYLLNGIIRKLDKKVPNLKKALLGTRDNLTVIIKILRYDGDGKMCTSPHYDKSGLTLVLDNDDSVNDKLIVGPYMDEFNFNRLQAPNRCFDNQKKFTSSILMSGACLEKVGIRLNPTPHAVLPSVAKHRHALIAFCLVPNINTTDVQTTIVDKNQINLFT